MKMDSCKICGMSEDDGIDKESLFLIDNSNHTHKAYFVCGWCWNDIVSRHPPVE